MKYYRSQIHFRQRAEFTALFFTLVIKRGLGWEDGAQCHHKRLGEGRKVGGTTPWEQDNKDEKGVLKIPWVCVAYSTGVEDMSVVNV